MAEGKLYARIHPDARQDRTVIRRRDTCGIVFERGVGPYKGWHPVTEEQAAKLRRQHMSPNNPNTMRVFQIEDKEQVDRIAGSEARAKMTPEAKRIDQTRENELAQVKQQLGDVQRLLSAFDPDFLARLVRLSELDKAASGAPISAEAGDRLEKVVAGPPRRPNLDERILDDDADKRTASNAATTNSATSNKQAPPPAARPGAQGGRPGAQPGNKHDGKKQDKDAPAPPARPGAAQAGPAVASSASPSDILDPSLLDDEDES